MTTQALTLPALSGARPADERVPFHKLVAIELRKTFNSRGAFWFAITIVAAMLAMMIGQVFGADEADQTVATYFANGAQLLGALLPIVALLLVSTEWTQRSAMTTLTQQPRRRELLLTKFTAAMLLGLVATALSLVSAWTIGLFAANESAGATSYDWEIVGQTTLMVLLSVASGFAFGCAFLKSAPAIVGYLLFPTIVVIVGSIGAIQGVVKWIDIGSTSVWATEKVMTTTEWKLFLVSSITWVVVPLAVGLWRVLRDEVG